MSINSIWVGDTAGVGVGILSWVDKILFATSSTEGTLFIDLIDAKKRTGLAGGMLINKIRGDKEKRINEFVAAILKQYPPQVK
jgi:hypothetical protein